MYGLMTRVLLALKHSGGREQSDFARNYECNSYIPKSFPSQGFLQEQSSSNVRAEIQKAVRLAAQTYSVRFCLWYCFNYLSQLQYRDKWGPAPCCALYQDHKPDSLRWSRKTAGCLGPQSLSSATLDCDQLGNFSWRMRSINVRRWAGVQNLKNGQVHHQSRKLPASLYKKCQLLSRSHNTVARSWRKATLCPGWLRSQETTRSSHC